MTPHSDFLTGLGLGVLATAVITAGTILATMPRVDYRILSSPEYLQRGGWTPDELRLRRIVEDQLLADGATLGEVCIESPVPDVCLPPAGVPQRVAP